MSSFVEFARAHGVLITRQLYPARKVQRCGTAEHPRSTNGAYLWDGERGWVMAWDGDMEIHWYGDAKRQWTAEEKARWRDERDAARASIAKRQRQAAADAEKLLSECELLEHGYLKLKGFEKMRGLVHMPDETLVVPMRDARTGALVGAQRIFPVAPTPGGDGKWTWGKKFIAGTRARGAVLRLGPRAVRETALCEGYATGLSIEQAAAQLRLSMAVLICFSADNLKHLAPVVSGRAIVVADNDKSGVGAEIARATGLPWDMPDVEGWDANDLHVERGLPALAGLLMRIREKAKAAA